MRAYDNTYDSYYLDQLDKLKADIETIKYSIIRKHKIEKGARIKEKSTGRVFVIDNINGNDFFHYSAIKGITTGDLTDHGDCDVLIFDIEFEVIK